MTLGFGHNPGSCMLDPSLWNNLAQRAPLRYRADNVINTKLWE